MVSRFIPAGAGNMAARRYRIARPAVYPRWRGEHRRRIIQRESSSGLSPLARGTLPEPLLTPLLSRFIPAGAGNIG